MGMKINDVSRVDEIEYETFLEDYYLSNMTNSKQSLSPSLNPLREIWAQNLHQHFSKISLPELNYMKSIGLVSNSDFSKQLKKRGITNLNAALEKEEPFVPKTTNGLIDNIERRENWYGGKELEPKEGEEEFESNIS